MNSCILVRTWWKRLEALDHCKMQSNFYCLFHFKCNIMNIGLLIIIISSVYKSKSWELDFHKITIKCIYKWNYVSFEGSQFEMCFFNFHFWSRTTFCVFVVLYSKSKRWLFENEPQQKKLFPVLRGNTEMISDLGQILKEIHFVIFTDVGYFWIMKGSSFSSHRVSLMLVFSPMFDEI